MMMDNVHGFSQEAEQYAPHSPQYPDALFVFLRDACRRRVRAPFGRHVFGLVMVAQAVHWLGLEQFFREAVRVLRPGGVLAVRGYGFSDITPKLNAILERNCLPQLTPTGRRGTAW